MAACCFARMLSLCVSKDDHDDDDEDPLLWRMDLPSHSCGDFSIAAVQANEVMEDHSQVETGLNAIFVGIYDGHRGPQASTFIRDHFFDILIFLARQNGTINERTLAGVIWVIENDFRKLVERTYEISPLIATIGSSLLVGVIWKGTLVIANVGDSRAVIGSVIPTTIRWRPPPYCVDFGARPLPVGKSKRFVTEQLTQDHTVENPEVRNEYREMPRYSPVDYISGEFFVQGLIKQSRSIGDIILKRRGYNLRLPGTFIPPEERQLPCVTAEPTLYTRVLQPKDKFIIFASRGLWEHITNDEAVDIVHKYPRIGIARRLIKAAQKVAAYNKEISKKELYKIEKGTRRDYHDDITVTVVFIDHEFLGKKVVTAPELSYKGFVDSIGPSKFNSIQELM